jgi:antitoxin ParD1/3/4
MNISLKPETKNFVDEQIRAGRFRSLDEVLEEALSRMMYEDADLDDETINAINRAEAQFDRGQGIDFNVFAAEARRKYSVQ